jgi:hypothetical protein
MSRRVILGVATALASLGTLIVTPALPASAHTLHCTNESVGGDATPYYNSIFSPAKQKISPTVLDKYVPQGLATWKNYYGKGHDLLVYTAYREPEGGGLAVIQGIDQRDGSLTNFAKIGKGHVGGVAISGKWAFVSGENNTVRRYSLSSLADVFAGRSKKPLKGANAGSVYAASFLAADGNVLYAGRFSGAADPGGAHRDKMYRYRISAAGKLSRIGTAADYIQVPAKTQGLLILPKYFVYSSSEGRTNRSNIYVVKRGIKLLDTADGAGSADHLSCFRAPTMTEGLAISQDRIYLIYESGASKYANNEDGKGTPDRVIKQLHSAKRADLPLLT